MSDEDNKAKEMRNMELANLKDSLMTLASVRPNYLDKDSGNEEVKQLIDDTTVSTLKKMKSLTSKVGK